ncbi:FAD-binding oxidoreductase [Microvirga sp. VF16]|uniref:FAD-binding oxidoreductase n=1 Tax=Microvirga sp. VF16 TaxID=2807101 RepID=UPI00193E1514|nr:FAD-binding oxidoreductase [Microvirga sp. VF16]QRM33061.1 FAD-binding oxidoreductase [Microvirga sp. VF16]
MSISYGQGSECRTAKLVLALRGVVGAENCIVDDEHKARYLVDWRKLYSGKTLAVIRPGTTEEAAAVVRACAAANVGVVPQGGNTGLVGGAIPISDGEEIIISLERMNRIRALDKANYTVTVEAGCVLSRLHNVVAEASLFFPLSLGAEGSCQIGGNLATNAGGNAVLRYGSIRNLALGLEVVLPNGQIWNGLRALRKDNAGYDLRNLFIGSEGTLGLITAAVLQLFPPPTHITTCVLGFPSLERLPDIYGFLRERLSYGLSAFELMPGHAVDLASETLRGIRRPMRASHPYYALVEVSDFSQDAVGNSAVEATTMELLERQLISDAVIAASAAQRRDFWKAREGIVDMQPLLGAVAKHDISVPVSNIGSFISQAAEVIDKIAPGVLQIAFGHVGDGNIHLNLIERENEKMSAFRARAQEIGVALYDLVDAFEGSFSAEHGIGQLRRQDLISRRSSIEIDVMRAVKRTIDPQGLFNRGKLFATP